MNKLTINQQYISVAGFTIRIVYHDTELYVAKKYFFDNIQYLIRDFTLQKMTVAVDFTIEVIWDEDQEIAVRESEKKGMIKFFEEINERKIRTYYQISLYQFQIILLRALYTLLTKNNGIIFHSSASQMQNGVVLFLAESGGGKSTITKLLSSSFVKFADDIVILRWENGGYYVYQVPFLEKDAVRMKSSKRYLLSEVFFINKSSLLKAQAINDHSEVFKSLLEQIYVGDKGKKELYKQVERFTSDYEFKILYFPKNKTRLIRYFNEKV